MGGAEVGRRIIVPNNTRTTNEPITGPSPQRIAPTSWTTWTTRAASPEDVSTAALPADSPRAQRLALHRAAFTDAVARARSVA